MTAINNLKNPEDIAICKADKRGAVVINEVEDYINEANRQLADKKFYKKLPENPTSEYAALVDNAIDGLRIQGKLDEKLAESLKTNNPKTPRFYLLPKIHKPNNPGRPVVSSIGCHTEKISQYVDHHLQPLNKALPSYVQDTTHFLQKLKSVPELPEDALLVTMDVRSLYTNVPNQEGIQAVQSYLRARSNPGDGILSKVITTFLTLNLTLNNFVFNDQNYVQINGASMGTKCSPTYSSLFMGKFEEINILPRIRDMIMIYVRYIDDIFFIWKGTEEELLNFFAEINLVHPTIKFDYSYSRKSVNFLDSKVSILRKKIGTSVYTKPTDRKAYLHAKSYHPRSTIEAIAYSQAARLRRICTEKTEFLKFAEKLKEDLTNRGHKEGKVTEEINRAANLNRETLLTYKQKPESIRVQLIVTYNKRLPNLKNIIDESWETLHINEAEKAKFKEKPLVCYRRNRNLRDILGQTRISKNRVMRKKHRTKGRCAPCRSRPDTKCCRHVIATTYFTNQAGNKKFDIWHKVGCKTRNAIYLAFCMKCNRKQYVGKVEKQGTNKKINNHRNYSKKEDYLHRQTLYGTWP